MLTYIIYEAMDKRLNEMFFLLQSFEDRGILAKSEWKDEAELCDQINSFLSMHIDAEWQLIMLDGKELYESDNPYDNGKTEEKINRLLVQSQQGVKQYKKNMNLLPPKYILLLSARKNRLITYPLSDNIYSDFYKGYPSNCRFWVVNIPEDEKWLTDKVIFRLLCGLLVILANDISEMITERQYMYELSWTMEQKEVENDLTEMMLRNERIEAMMPDNNQIYTWEEDFFQELPEPIFCLSGSKEIKKVKGNVKSLLKKNENDVLMWKMQNNSVLEQIKKLRESPVGRWEKEIEEAKWDTLEDMDILKEQVSPLNKESRYRLRKAKEECAENIFKLKLNIEEKKELLDKAINQEERIEKLIETRMTKRSFGKSLIETVLGTMLMLFLGFGLSNKMRGDNIVRITFGAVCVILAVWFVVWEIYLYYERISEKNGLNDTIKEINDCLENDDFKYNSLLASITQHKKYSLLEQEQMKFDAIKKEKKLIWKKHREKSAMFKENMRKLCWILGYAPVISNEKNKMVEADFLKNPEYFEYYYLPSIDLFSQTIIDGWGNNILVPFSFMKKIGVRKVCLVQDGSMHQGEGKK